MAAPLSVLAKPRLTACPAHVDMQKGLGVRFVQPPTDMGPVTTAVFDDTCGNLIQIASMPAS